MNRGKMDELDVETFLSKLRAADTDKKVDLVQDFAERLGGTPDLPESTFDAVTLAIAPLIRTSSNQLLSIILNSFLPAYFRLIPDTPSSNSVPLKLAVHQCLPALLERLNDPKERVHAPAATCVAQLGKKCYHHEPPAPAVQAKGKEKETLVGFWERNVKDTMAIKGKGWRGKVEGMKLLLAMREDKSSGLALKPWLGMLVDLLEDSDSHVRDQARETVVALLSPASTPPAARSEVKKLLTTKGVRKTIADGILARIFSPSGTSTPAPDPAADDASSAGGGIRSRAPTPLGDEIPIVHIASSRDMEQEWSKMAVHFQGKETEHNWNPREKSIVRIRGMLRGHAHQHYPEAFLAGLKSSMIDGLSRTLLSLRTTLAQQSCAAVQELAEYLGSALDPFVESLLGVLGKMAGFTKKIIAERSQRALASIITHSTARPHIFISHISAGIAEKNVQTRQYCTTHLKTFLDTQAGRTKVTIDTTPGSLASLDDDVRKALADTTPQVRELGRAAFWSFNALWLARGAEIISTLDGTARKQLEKADPKAAEGSKSRVASLKGAPKRPSVVSQMLAEKRKEIAASRQGTPRNVSSPAGILPRTNPERAAPISPPKSPTPAPMSFNRTMTSPPTATPQRMQGPPLASRLPRAIGSPPMHSAHSRSPSLGHIPTSPTSPPNRSTPGSPSNSRSPLRSHDTFPSALRSPSSSSANSGSGTHMLKTPVLARSPLPTFHDPPVGALGLAPSPPAANGHEPLAVDEELKAQADEAVLAAEKLLELNVEATSPTPITPARPPEPRVNGRASQYRTPATMFLNSHARPAWEDSPRPESVTPQMLSKLRERKHEKSWWLRQRALMDTASPLRASGPPSAMIVHRSAEALSAGPGKVTVLDLQKIALFAQDHPVYKLADEEDDEEQRRIWEGGRLFDLVFDGLMELLNPSTELPLLENALVLLWELVQHQWILFEDREMALADGLFRLRAHRNHTVLESTNSLISLLVEISDPLFFLSVLRGAYNRFISLHPTPPPVNGAVSTLPNGSAENLTRSSGELFGLTSFGMCILKLPREVVRIEGSRLGPVVMEALSSTTTTTRQAANTLILAIQVILADAQATIALFPQLNEAQKNLGYYFMEKSGLLRRSETDALALDGGREAVDGKITDLLGRGVDRKSSTT